MTDNKTETHEDPIASTGVEATQEAEKDAETVLDNSEERSDDSDETSAAEETSLEKAEKEAAEMKARWLRSVADLENYRKRIAREKQEIIRSAAANVIESLLPVLDNMKLGMQAAENHPEAKDVVVGFKMVDDQFKRVLQEQGLEEIAPDGETFDPNLHECISQQLSETVEEGKVILTVRSGYRLNEKLIRAANVIVSSGPEQSS